MKKIIIVTSVKNTWESVKKHANDLAKTDFALLVFEPDRMNVYERLDWTEEILTQQNHSDKRIVIATMNEEVILRTLRMVRNKKINCDDVVIAVVCEDGEIQYHNIDATGEFIDKWRDGFFQHRADELFEED